MGRMYHRTPFHDTLLSKSLVPPAGSGKLRAWDLVEVKRDFVYEMIPSFYRPTDDDRYAAVYHLRMNALYSIMLSRHFI